MESFDKSNNIIGQKRSNTMHKIFQTSNLEDDKETDGIGFIEESSSSVGY